VSWVLLTAVAALMHLTVIGGVEVFWRLFTGGFSPLMGGFALVLTWVILVRVFGEVFFDPGLLYYPAKPNRS
jgi:hypothetical protein